VMRKVTMRIDDNQTEDSGSKEKTAKVIIQTKKKAFQKSVDYPLGHPGNPFDETDMYEKFSMCLEGIYPKSVQKSLYDKLSSLDKYHFKHFEEELLRHTN